MVARSSYRIYPKGVRLASGYPVEKGGRRDRPSPQSRLGIEGSDWRFWFKEALDEMHVELTRLARTTTRMRVIGLVMPSVMLYPYRCSWMRSRYFGIKQSKWRFKEGFPILSFPRRYLQDNDVQRGAIVKDRNSRRCEESTREKWDRGEPEKG